MAIAIGTHHQICTRGEAARKPPILEARVKDDSQLAAHGRVAEVDRKQAAPVVDHQQERAAVRSDAVDFADGAFVASHPPMHTRKVVAVPSNIVENDLPKQRTLCVPQ